jgi:DNA polymerase III alpha subunit (gram-positive type)
MKFSQELDFVALDIETTGLSEHKDEIIEIAAVKIRNGEIVEVFDSFVRPKGKVPKFIQFLTHISLEQLQGAPDIKEVLLKTQGLRWQKPIVGHNVGVDLGFINHQLWF